MLLQELKEVVDQIYDEAEFGSKVTINEHYEMLGLIRKLENATKYFKDNGLIEKV